MVSLSWLTTKGRFRLPDSSSTLLMYVISVAVLVKRGVSSSNCPLDPCQKQSVPASPSQCNQTSLDPCQKQSVPANPSQCNQTSLDPCQKQSVPASSSQCNQTILDTLLTVDRVPALNSASCIAQCKLDVRCSTAVFAPDKGDSCLLMSTDSGTSTAIPLALDQPDCLTFRLNVVRCQNCGTPFRFSCLCPDEFYGPLCQFSKPAHCKFKRKQQLAGFDYGPLSRREVPVVCRTLMTDGTYIFYQIDKVHSVGGSLFVLAQPILSLALNEENFADPPVMEFTGFGINPAMYTKMLYLDGTAFPDHLPRPNPLTIQNHLLAAPAYLTDPIVSYNPVAGTGTSQFIIDKLSIGQRLMSRTLQTVVFMPDRDMSVITTRYIDRAQHSTNNLNSPIVLEALKDVMADDMEYKALYTFGQGVHDTWSEQGDGRRWDIDGCWYSPEPGDGVTRMSLIRDAVLRGHQVRAVSNSFSIDIIQVTLTSNDFVAEAAPIVTPLDEGESLDSSSKVVRFAFRNENKRTTKGVCESEISTNNPASPVMDTIEEEVTWYVDLRRWRNVLKMNGNGDVVQGSIQTLQTELKLLYDLRACIEFEGPRTMCISDGKVFVRGLTVNVLMQTKPFLQVGFDEQGYFNGISDASCSLHQYLISTDGWIRGIRYIVGNTTASLYDVPFKTVTWFLHY